MNQYTSIPNPLGSGTVTPTYNSRGDLTYDGKFNYTYDDEDRMTSAEAVDHYQKALYSYDAQNHLVSETVLSDYSDGTYLDSTTTDFAYDGDELIAEMDSSGNLLKSYEWGIGINGKVGALLSVTDDTGESPVTYDAINDASGNVVELVNPSGIVAASYTYTTVGMRYADGPAHTVCNIGDDGSYVDPVTGNTITINRIKDWLGFWTTPDPTGQQSDVNLYRVDRGDQINYSDPSGLDAAATQPATTRPAPLIVDQNKLAKLRTQVENIEKGIQSYVNNAENDFNEENSAIATANMLQRGPGNQIPQLKPSDLIKGWQLKLADIKNDWKDYVDNLQVVGMVLNDQAAVAKFEAETTELESLVAKDGDELAQDLEGAEETSTTGRPAPAAENYRGRYNAARAAEGKPRLPEDWDAHHRIPQMYRDDPNFKGFDFDAPSNIQGVQGARSAENFHQLITNDWDNFSIRNPAATRQQIENFAKQMDVKYGKYFFK